MCRPPRPRAPAWIATDTWRAIRNQAAVVPNDHLGGASSIMIKTSQAAPLCRTALVMASTTIRYAAVSIAAGSAAGSDPDTRS